jgi:hypothetical protein
MNEQIVIDVSPSGATKIDAVNYEGNACSLATEQLEIVIGGGTAKKKDYKPEFSLPNSSHQDTKMTF